MQQDASVLMIGERTNANGSKAFRERCSPVTGRSVRRDRPRGQPRRLAPAHLCVDYVGRDGAADMPGDRRPVRDRLHATDHARLRPSRNVIEAGLGDASAAVASSTLRQLRDGDGPTRGSADDAAGSANHGCAAVVALTIDEEGQARTAEWKVRVAGRLIDDLTTNWGLRREEHPGRLPDVPDLDRPGGRPRRDAIETIEAIRQITVLYPASTSRSACRTSRSA